MARSSAAVKRGSSCSPERRRKSRTASSASAPPVWKTSSTSRLRSKRERDSPMDMTAYPAQGENPSLSPTHSCLCRLSPLRGRSASAFSLPRGQSGQQHLISCEPYKTGETPVPPNMDRRDAGPTALAYGSRLNLPEPSSCTAVIFCKQEHSPPLRLPLPLPPPTRSRVRKLRNFVLASSPTTWPHRGISPLYCACAKTPASLRSSCAPRTSTALNPR